MHLNPSLIDDLESRKDTSLITILVLYMGLLLSCIWIKSQSFNCYIHSHLLIIMNGSRPIYAALILYRYKLIHRNIKTLNFI